MKTIILVCSAGMSTSLLMKKIENEIISQNLQNDLKVLAIPESTIDDVIAKESINLMLIAPQIKYLESSIRNKVDNKFPVALIPMQKYGLMDGKGILEDALILLKE
jgi:PTS system cellobiose-specific IIB component